MRYWPEAAGNRREFLRSGARYGLLACLVVFAGVNGARGRKRGDRKCDGVCSGCDAFAGCGLPQALSAKRGKGV